MSTPETGNKTNPARTFSSDRLIIARLSRAAKGGLLSVTEGAEALGLPRRTAALKLAALARRGWLLRVRRGLYFIVPLESEPGRPVTLDDPWVLAREVFSPCYIGGWSAAEYWGLTEQIFRSILVVTAAHVRGTFLILLGHEYRLFKVASERIDVDTLVWRGPERVAVSSRERTIVDRRTTAGSGQVRRRQSPSGRVHLQRQAEAGGILLSSTSRNRQPSPLRLGGRGDAHQGVQHRAHERRASDQGIVRSSLPG